MPTAGMMVNAILPRPAAACETKTEESPMKWKRTALSLVIAATALPALAQTAQPFPTRPIRIIVAFTAGASADLVARRLGPKMSESWGQQVVVDNRPGAGGVLGTGLVAAAAPNGYTLLVHSLAFAVSAAVYAKLPYDPFRDFSGVSQISASPSVIVVAPALGVKSVNDLIALAKQKPGQLNYASAGIGSGTHLNGEQFKFTAGINVAHVPYKGPSEALLDVMTGRIQYFISPMVPALPFIRDGRLIPLAVTTALRTPMLPDVPSVSEAALPGYEYQAWFGMWAPGGTPRPIVEKLSKEVARIVELPDVAKQFANQGELVRTSTPEEFTQFCRAEIEKYRKIVKLANIRVE
jgi:tripartite-type tricarboxylate transporter receptor subunit TctC